jgi:hypothetical protein
MCINSREMLLIQRGSKDNEAEIDLLTQTQTGGQDDYPHEFV